MNNLAIVISTIVLSTITVVTHIMTWVTMTTVGYKNQINARFLVVSHSLPGIASGGSFPVASIISLKLSEL